MSQDGPSTFNNPKDPNDPNDPTHPKHSNPPNRQMAHQCPNQPTQSKCLIITISITHPTRSNGPKHSNRPEPPKHPNDLIIVLYAFS